jgi:rubredoxin
MSGERTLSVRMAEHGYAPDGTKLPDEVDLRDAQTCPVCGWPTQVRVREQGPVDGWDWRCKVCDLGAENRLLRESRDELARRLGWTPEYGWEPRP